MLMLSPTCNFTPCWCNQKHATEFTPRLCLLHIGLFTNIQLIPTYIIAILTLLFIKCALSKTVLLHVGVITNMLLIFTPSWCYRVVLFFVHNRSIFNCNEFTPCWCYHQHATEFFTTIVFTLLHVGVITNMQLNLLHIGHITTIQPIPTYLIAILTLLILKFALSKTVLLHVCVITNIQPIPTSLIAILTLLFINLF
jgi:hypothetical protein